MKTEIITVDKEQCKFIQCNFNPLKCFGELLLFDHTGNIASDDDDDNDNDNDNDDNNNNNNNEQKTGLKIQIMVLATTTKNLR
jgi:hypothetical protein